MSKKKKSKKKKNETIVDEYEVFGEFAFIAGYTEGGVQYGITHEKMEDGDFLKESNDSELEINDEDLPF